MAAPTLQQPPVPSCTFINLTDNPGDGRDKRRNFVRRTVMLDYHYRRRKQHSCKNSQEQVLRPRTRKQSSTTEEIPTEYATSNSHPPSLHIEESEIVEARKDSRDADIESNTTPPFLCPLEPRSAQLFQPKQRTDPHLALISRLIRRFLLGQTVKAAWDISHVTFVHRRFRDEVDFGCDNPLNRCIQLLRRVFGGGEGSTSSSVAVTDNTQHAGLWEMVHEEQERIYAQVRMFELRSLPPFSFIPLAT